jgi:hypothetical protein
MFGSPGLPNGFEEETIVTETVLVDVGESWDYFKGKEHPSDPPSAWVERDFDASGWLSGPTGIGYADDDDATVLEDMQDSYVSVFCRKTFEVEDASSIEDLVLKVVYDDGFAAYLNGEELGRRNLGSPGEVYTYDTPAWPSVGNVAATAEISVPKSLLVEGTNVLAVQIHNSSASSTDLTMIPSLMGRTEKTTGGVTPMPVVINEYLVNPAADSFVELFNNSASGVNVGLTYLSSDPDDLTRYRIPQGTILPAWGHIAFTGTEMGFSLTQGDGAIYFTSADGQRVIDAYAYGGSFPEISRGRHPDGEERWYNMPTTTPGEANSRPGGTSTPVVINEIMYHPYENNDDAEYIELYNGGSEAVDMTGWSFTQGVNFAFPPGTILGPGEYLVVGKDRNALYKKYRLSNVIGNYGGNLDNEGEKVELTDLLGNVVDEVRYASGEPWPVWAAGWGSSLELIDPRQDNRAPSAWAASDERDRAEWTHVEYTADYDWGGESEFHFFLMHRGECLIDDISLKREDQEYIPNGSFESGTSGWKIEGNHIQSAIYTDEAHTGSRCLKIVATGRGDTGANRIECDTTSSLRGGQPYTVSFWVKWQRGINLIYTRTHGQGLAKASRFVMPARRGTPGKPNSVYTPNLGPVIWGVTQKPIVPMSSDPVRVTARIGDSDGVASAILYYKGDYDGSFGSVPMRDDGLQGDRRAGDGLYTGEIPARKSVDLMRFYLLATDALAASQRFPAKDGTYCLYLIEDSPPVTKFPVYRILLTHEVDQQLRGRNRLSNELADCTFVLNNSEIFYNCGVRTRGSGWTRESHPSSHYRVEFPGDQPLRGVWGEVNLDWRQDNTRQKERLVQHLLRQLGGVPTSYQRYVHVRFNRDFYALAEEPQKVDGDYVRFYWPDDAAGTLFKVDDHFEWTDGWSHSHWDAYLRWQGPEEGEWEEASEKEKYRWNWELRTNEKEDDYSDFLKFVRFMDPNQTRDIDFDYVAESVLDVDEWLKVLCVRFLVDDWDTLGYDRGKNAYIYRPYHEGEGTPDDPPRYGRWTLIPWDSDLTFEDANAPIVSDKFPSIKRMLERPRFQRRYYSYFLKLLDGPFSRTEIDPIVDTIYRAFSGEQGAPSSPGSIKSFVSSRSSVIRSRIPRREFAITTNAGEDFEVEESRVTLEGTAPVTARTVTLKINDGPEAPFGPTWVATTDWRATFAVPPGENLFQLTAWDEDGNVVGTSMITISYRLSPTKDSDNDGLYDREEHEVYHTEYMNPDTDGDGLRDGDEVHLHFTDPTSSDSDGDELPDGWEVDHGLDPNLGLGDDAGTGDPDADGLMNVEELASGTDPRNSDTDGDGMDDRSEVLSGTDPTDETSFFRIVGIVRDGEGFSVTWTSVPGREYAVYGSEVLMNWELLEVLIGDGDTTNFHGSDTLPGSARFYRIEALPPP